MIQTFLLSFWKEIAGFIAVISALFIARQSGKNAEKAKHERKAHEQTQKQLDLFRGRPTSDSVDDRLRNYKK